MKKTIYRFIRLFDIVLAIVCAIIMGTIAIGQYVMPDSVVQYRGDSQRLSALFSYSDSAKTRSVDYQTVSSKETVKLLGVVPVKEIKVTHKEAPSVYVSGEAFGIKLYTDGVIVVGTQSVMLEDKKVNPAEEAGIRVGDIIISINNVDVFSSDDVSSLLNDNNGEPYKIKVKRDERYKNFVLTPVYSDKEGCYKAGMWVRDSTAGIGTITFYNKENGTFALLGHPINDVDTKKIMPMLEGEAVGATVRSVQKPSAGATGSLVCDFNDNVIGKLLLNTECGVYGAYSSVSSLARAYPVASCQEIDKGFAQIISTVDSGNPRAYSINISKISYSGNGERDIVFKVVDKDLLKKTGGIVQGMSGSPIIQNGKIIGAVTHVIVDNPEKGYGIFAQTMVEQSNKIGE